MSDKDIYTTVGNDEAPVGDGVDLGTLTTQVPPPENTYTITVLLAFEDPSLEDEHGARCEIVYEDGQPRHVAMSSNGTTVSVGFLQFLQQITQYGSGSPTSAANQVNIPAGVLGRSIPGMNYAPMSGTYRQYGPGGRW